MTTRLMLSVSLLSLSANAVASELITFEEVTLNPERGIYSVEVSNIGPVNFDNPVCGSRCIEGINVQDMAQTFSRIHLWASGPQVGTISNGTSISVVGGGKFDFESAYLGQSHPFTYEPFAYWITINGYANGNLLFSKNLWPGQTASLVDFRWKGIDRLAFNTRINSGHVIIDDISLSIPAPIPEPDAYAMMLAGLGVMGSIAKRRKGVRG